MPSHQIALSTNDYTNLADTPFGKSHYFRIYQVEQDGYKMIDTRENVLFSQACDLTGRAQHLHGLLGDVQYLVGSQFEKDVRQKLEEMGYHIIEVEPDKIAALLPRLPESLEPSIT